MYVGTHIEPPPKNSPVFERRSNLLQPHQILIDQILQPFLFPALYAYGAVVLG